MKEQIDSVPQVPEKMREEQKARKKVERKVGD
jgi:hypothetical protein